jgi:holo-[acyl-carrier protein] synthase
MSASVRSPGPVSVGIDSVLISEVARSIDDFGDRYLDRVYTRHEQDSCAGDTPVRARSLAARFAAKEATIKVLRPDADVPPWTSIEIQRHPAGWCDIGLTGVAAQLAQDAGIAALSVSLTHEGDTATAVVVAVTDPNHIPTGANQT